MKKKHEEVETKKKETKYNKSKARRGKRKSLKTIRKSVRFLGVNTAGLKSKLTSFKKVINDLKPAVFFLEETKYRDAGKLNIGNNFISMNSQGKTNKEGGLP